MPRTYKQGKDAPFFGKHHSTETKKKIGAASLGNTYGELATHNHDGTNNPNYKHGDTGTKLWMVWIGIKQRCYNNKCSDYPRYGGRGVSMCEEWKDFILFKEWAITNGYQEGLTIDRIDNNGNYDATNGRWVTRVENISKDAGKSSRKPVGQFDLNGTLVATYVSAKQAGRETGFSQGNISNVCRGEQRQTNGFRWEYI